METTQKKRSPLQSLRVFQRFMPYFRPYMGVMLLDLFCATLTTVCDLVLPLIVRFITGTITTDAAALTIAVVLLFNLILMTCLRLFGREQVLQLPGRMADAPSGQGGCH